VCHENYNYELANQKFEDVSPDAEAMEFFYVCAPVSTIWIVK